MAEQTMPQKRRAEIEREERRKKVAANLLAGLNYREIANALNVSIGTVSNDVEALLKRWRAEQVTSVGEWSALNVKRLDRAINAIWGEVADGNLAAIDRLQKLIEQIDTLLNSGGMQSMMWTISLMLIALGFGGALERTGCLEAIINAIVNALGIKHIDMPATPERVWRAANGGRQAAA
jgi:predicted histidine transporter YuiF (NhaC family)